MAHLLDKIMDLDMARDLIVEKFEDAVESVDTVMIDTELALDKQTERSNSQTVDEEEIINRLVDRAREDDKPDIIKNRFKTYNLETQPLIPFYEKRKIMFNINGMQEIEKVSEDIKKVIGVI